MGEGEKTAWIEKKGENCTMRKREKNFVFWGVRDESGIWWKEGWLWRLLKGSDSKQQPKRAKKAGAQFGKEWWERHSKVSGSVGSTEGNVTRGYVGVVSEWIIGTWRERATWLGGSGCLGGYVNDLQYSIIHAKIAHQYLKSFKKN